MDDTLFDHSLTCRAALARLRRDTVAVRGRPLDDLWHEYGRLLELAHTDVMLGRRTADEVRTERFLRLAAWSGHPIDRARASELSRAYREYYQALRRPVRGAPEVLRALSARTRIGIVTNNTVAEQRGKIAFLHLERDVDFLVTSEEVGVAKPDPRIFRTALEHAGSDPESAIMIGDSWEDDVEGARGVGIPAIWFNRFHTPRPSVAPVPEFSRFGGSRQFERLVARRQGLPSVR